LKQGINPYHNPNPATEDNVEPWISTLAFPMTKTHAPICMSQKYCETQFKSNNENRCSLGAKSFEVITSRRSVEVSMCFSEHPIRVRAGGPLVRSVPMLKMLWHSPTFHKHTLWVEVQATRERWYAMNASLYNRTRVPPTIWRDSDRASFTGFLKTTRRPVNDKDSPVVAASFTIPWKRSSGIVCKVSISLFVSCELMGVLLCDEPKSATS